MSNIYMIICPQRFNAHNMEELPFVAPENNHYEDGRQGRGFCQVAHQQIRVLFHQASDVVKNQGGKNDFIKVYTSVTGVLSISGPEL